MPAKSFEKVCNNLNAKNIRKIIRSYSSKKYNLGKHVDI